MLPARVRIGMVDVRADGLRMAVGKDRPAQCNSGANGSNNGNKPDEEEPKRQSAVLPVVAKAKNSSADRQSQRSYKHGEQQKLGQKVRP